MHKYELQSSYFSKTQYLLHCIVKHNNNEEQSMYTYLYHLSHAMCYNHAFTSTVVDYIISLETPLNLVRFKPNNCSAQYKSKHVFCYWQSVAKELNTKCLIHYGISKT